MNDTNSSSAELCAEAMHLLKRGLELLDSADAPAEIGANVDLALCRLLEHLEAQQELEARRRHSTGSSVKH